MTPEQWQEASDAEARATSERAHEVLHAIERAGLQIDQRLALALVYVGVLMSRDLDVPEDALALWLPRLYRSPSRVIEPVSKGDA